MIKAKKLLSNEEISDLTLVSNYITKSFNKRKPKKSDKLYINLCNIYNVKFSFNNKSICYYFRKLYLRFR